MKTIAVTGGTGFVGGALLTALQRKGYDVRALARSPDKLAATQGIAIVPGSLSDEDALRKLIDGADGVIHLAGLTHARQDIDFQRVNVEGAARVARIAAAYGAALVHASSMSARQPETSPYARSKYESEGAVAERCSEWRALRLPAIYGPGDMVTLPYFKLVKSGFALEPATREAARASILYVEDAAKALIAALEEALGPGVYEVGDDEPEGHSWREIGETLARVMGREAKSIRVPRPVITVYHGVLRRAERLTGWAPSVRTGQVNEFFHPDWVAREPLLSSHTSWRAHTSLEEGFAKTARWYQEKGLI